MRRLSRRYSIFSMATARDLDRHGGMDLASISFFPDFRKHPNKASYFENDGKKFTAHATYLAPFGRWLVMESGDFDEDGDLNILLGASNFKGRGASATKNKFDQDLR